MGPMMLSERYALDDAIARGGMATVYRARDEVLARAVAVKVLHPSLAEDESFIERFRREALAAARLTHPNIVSIYDTGIEEGDKGPQHFIVMEFCGGGTLAGLAATEGPLQIDRIVSVGAAICDALSYGHKHEVIHRDIKPGNVLLADDGTVKVGDFGIAKAAFTGRDLTTSGSLLGTVTYVSPEQARGEEPDERSDIYSLGVVLYELATGRPPFAGDSPLATAMLHVKEPPPPPRSIRGGIPRDFEEVVLAALAKDPADRPTSADDFRTRLSKGHSTGATAVIKPVPAPPASAPSGRSGDASWVARVFLLVAAVVVIAIAVGWLLGAEEREGAQQGEGGNGGPAGTEIQISTASDFDPEGDDVEHGESVAFAYDGIEETFWETETYDDGFAGVDKSGVGLVFDLGDSIDVTAVEVVTRTPGMSLEVRVADSPGTDQDDYEVVAEVDSAEPAQEFEVDGSGQYWLLWITELPPTSGRAIISEVRFFEP